MARYQVGIKMNGKWGYDNHVTLSDALRDAAMFMGPDFPHVEAVAVTALDSANNKRAVFKRPDPLVEAEG